MKDASVLLDANRHSNAMYLMGYAVEIALKRRISLTLGFTHGFPETRQEFAQYAAIINSNFQLQTPLKTLYDIRNHDLTKLLSYSGSESQIRQDLMAEWLIVSTWNPEHRYRIRRNSQVKAGTFIQSARKIISKTL